MFGKIYLKQDANGYFIEDVYCQKRFSADSKVGTNSIPNQDRLNCEHTWPQSKFTNLYPKEVQKADLHHLYPSDSKANSIRGNVDFADIASDNGDLEADDCSTSKAGTSTTSGGDYFEPPTNHKGNVARSLFYFSVRYKISIPRAEEEVLRKWNEIDPIDQDEINKNEIIYSVQKNRNPFIDYPELINSINKF
jgi:endonuclease I